MSVTDYIQVGKAGERFARDLLRGKDYQILVTNYRTRLGEIDIVAKKDEVFVFVEVKARVSTKFGKPYEAVTAHKFQKMKMMAEIFSQNFSLANAKKRIDVISVELAGDLTIKNIDHFENVDLS